MLIWLYPLKSHADFGVFISGGQVTGQLATEASRHGLIWRSNSPLWQNQQNKVTWQIETAFSHWNNQYFSDIDVISITPVFHYNFNFYQWDMFAGGGIGIAKLSGDRLSSRDLGSDILFDDKLVIGINWHNKHQLSFAIHHYSNANLASANDGSSFLYLSYGYFF